MAAGLHRRRQPRRYHPDGRPARPDAHLRLHGAGRQQGGPAGRRGGHRGPGERPTRTPPTPSRPAVTGWLDARAPDEQALDRAGRRDRRPRPGAGRAGTAPRSPDARSPARRATEFDAGLRDRIVAALGGAPTLPTGAGHDAGVLAAVLPTAMLFVRNPTGVSHAPGERPPTPTARPASPRWPQCSGSWHVRPDLPRRVRLATRPAGRRRHRAVPTSRRQRRRAFDDGRRRRHWTSDDGRGPRRRAFGDGSRRRPAGAERGDRGGRRPDHRAAPGQRTRTGRHAPARADPAGPGQRALARLPPGAARARPGRPGHLLDLAGADVLARRPARPRLLPARWPEPSSARWRWPE